MNGVGVDPKNLYGAHFSEAEAIERSTRDLYAKYRDHVAAIEEGFFESDSAFASRAALDVAADGLRSTLAMHSVNHLAYAQGLSRNHRDYRQHEAAYFDMARADMEAGPDGKPYEDNNPYKPLDQR